MNIQINYIHTYLLGGISTTIRKTTCKKAYRMYLTFVLYTKQAPGICVNNCKNIKRKSIRILTMLIE